MQLRQATSEDTTDIAKVHVDSWKATYQGIVPDSYLNTLSYQQRTELWKRNIADQDNYIIVAENKAGQIVGFVSAGKKAENTIEHSGDLTSIYLLEEYQGRGIGRKLLAEALHHFKQLGYKKVFVEVLADNKSRYFYEHYGATIAKTVQININGKILNEHIYVWNDLDKFHKLIDHI
ncbi:GNAT family N-acetyltransferase [Amphibacillus sp. Q70]|uniref:GNAT family N-acetyltransferase n=1 Tax=Amphibacillus sp. Q70 TaxID=3453416 RepID=UPI003F83BD9A